MFKKIIFIIAIVIITVSILAIFGWILQIELLTQIVSGLPTMKFNTALSFMLLGVVLIFIIKHINLATAHIVNGILLVIGIATLSQDVFGVSFGLDELFVPDQQGILLGNLHPGRMSSATSLSFLLLSISLLLIMIGKPKVLVFAAYLSQAVAFFSFLVITIYFFKFLQKKKLPLFLQWLFILHLDFFWQA